MRFIAQAGRSGRWAKWGWVIGGASALALGGPARAAEPPGADLTAPTAALHSPHGQLVLIRENELVGRIAGGGYDVKIDADVATGHGPGGPIDVAFKPSGGGYSVSGTWNGGDLNFVVHDDSLVGDALRPGASDNRSFKRCTFDVLSEVGSSSTYRGRIDCGGAVQNMRLELPVDASAAGLGDQKTAVMLIAYLLTAPPA